MNIFKKDNQDDPLWFVIFFTVVTLAIIAIIGIFLVSVLSEDDVDIKNSPDSEMKNSAVKVEQKNNKKVKTKYNNQLDEIIVLLENDDATKKESVERTEKFLFEAGVPKDYLDTHFGAAMEFRASKQELENKSKKETKSKLLEILKNLKG